MNKVKLAVEALRVESFETAAAPGGAGTVRGHEDTLERACQTQQYDCTVQGGYTCDYGSCVGTCPWNCDTVDDYTCYRADCA